VKGEVVVVFIVYALLSILYIKWLKSAKSQVVVFAGQSLLFALGGSVFYFSFLFGPHNLKDAALFGTILAILGGCLKAFKMYRLWKQAGSR